MCVLWFGLFWFVFCRCFFIHLKQNKFYIYNKNYKSHEHKMNGSRKKKILYLPFFSKNTLNNLQVKTKQTLNLGTTVLFDTLNFLVFLVKS